MKIKTKLNFGIGVLVALIAFLAVITIRQIGLLAQASKNIIKDNKESIFYIQSMQKAMGSTGDKYVNFIDFEYYLDKQVLNVTELGERELTDKLYATFSRYKSNPSDSLLKWQIQNILFDINSLNLDAIDQKNKIATSTANSSIFLISLISFICFVISLVLLLRLPSSIYNPIKELIASIKLVAEKDYSQRVNFVDHNELGELAMAFNVMAARLDEYNRSNLSTLLAEKKITETLINKIQYPIIGFNKDLMVTLVNDEFLSITSLSKDEVVEKSLYELALQNEFVGKLVSINADSTKFYVSNKNKRVQVEKDGRDIYFEKEIQEISFSENNDGHTSLFGYFIVLRNITKYMELDLAKTNFIATISHELKTPISSILLSLHLLENEKTGLLNKEQFALVDSCAEDANRLLKLTAELLNFTQVETGKIQLNILPSALCDMIKYAIAANKSFADQKGISFEVNMPEYLPHVMVDKEKTAWVLTNIISNAIRYSGEGLKIVVDVLDKGDKQVVSVRDFGQGIETIYIDRIFDRYFRVPGTQKEGSGLGLAISKEFIEAQGGKIFVESKYGVGSVFSVVLNVKG